MPEHGTAPVFVARLQPVKLYLRSGRWVVSQVGSMDW